MAMAILSFENGMEVLGQRAKLARLFLLAFIVLDALLSVCIIAEWQGLVDLEAVEPDPAALAYFFVALGYTLAFLAAVIFVAMWLYRAHANLRDAGVDGLAISPGWAVGWYFVPIANLFRPLEAMRELWANSHGEGDRFADDAHPQIGAWWGCWIVGNILSSVGTQIEMMDSPSVFSVGLQVASSIGLIGAAWLLRNIISLVTEAQPKMVGLTQTFS